METTIMGLGFRAQGFENFPMPLSDSRLVVNIHPSVLWALGAQVITSIAVPDSLKLQHRIPQTDLETMLVNLQLLHEIAVEFREWAFACSLLTLNLEPYMTRICPSAHTGKFGVAGLLSSTLLC